MKNTSINQQSLVSIFTVMLLVFCVLGILFTSPFLAGCGGDEEEDTPEASVGANPLTDDEKEVSPVAEVPPVVEDEEEVPAVDDGSCQVGDILAPGESCIHPNGDKFSVDADGRGNLGGWLTAGKGIHISSNNFTFDADRQADGTWVIKNVGGNPVEVDNLDARCEIPPLNEDWGGEPVLFSVGREGTGAILLSDGKFVVFIYKDPADPPPIEVYGGPVQTATKALVQFVGFDFLNKDGEEVPDGKVTENEVSDAFAGVIDLEENRRILKMKIPEQKGETIKGDITLTMRVDITGPCTLDINKVPPALSAELIEYAKELLDIMQ